MLIKTLYVRFYKSFNYDYLRKSDPGARPDPWDTMRDGLFYPFVRIPMERNITTVVGANESGKSQLLAAIKHLLTGEGIKRRDFCRYSSFFSVDKEMSFPEFGAEFSDVSAAEADVVRRVAKLADAEPVDSFCFFRFNGRSELYVQENSDWSAHELTQDDLESFIFPTYFAIDAHTPIPDNVPMDYLGPTKSRKARTRRQWLNRQQIVRDNPDWFESTQKYQENAQEIAAIFGPDGSDEDEETLAGMKLAEDLLIGVAGIDRSAFQELQDAVKESEGYANGLVDKMNRQLANALNFPKWWSQDSEFSLYLTLRDFDLVFTVRDRTGSDYSFSERSGGLKYFLSYFVQYLAHEPTGGQEILLMDEPDAYLSTSGQQDLLKVFDSFASPENADRQPVQVIYVTHSPFLIDKNHGERIRVLEKGDGEEGTRVVKNAAKNHYEPLRSAFGAFVAETAFISNCNLMLEGQADQVLLAGISSFARRLNSREDTLDLNSLTLVPAGSASHIPYMVYLARGRDVDRPAVVVLLDGDSEGKRAAQELVKGFGGKKLISSEFVIELSDLSTEGLSLSTSQVQEIEDLIPSDTATLAIKEFAREVLTPSQADAVCEKLAPFTVLTDEKLFVAAQKAATKASKSLERPLKLDKVGFARALLRVLENVGEASRQTTLANFHILFREINKRQRSALRDNARERITKTLNRLRHSFLRDHPTTARRREVDAFLEDVEAQLIDTSPEAELIRKTVREIRNDFKLEEEPATMVEDFEALKSKLESLVYENVRYSQVD